MNIQIFPPEEMLEAQVLLPLSKSMSARALIINKIYSPDNAPAIEVSECDDTAAMLRGLSVKEGVVDIGAAGTAMRFLTAYYAATPGTDVTVDGSERMRQRPIGILVDALRQLGADIEYVGNEGFPPLHIRGRQLAGGKISLDPSVSSQFVSALMMIAPLMSQPLTLDFETQPTSMAYIRMTAKMMESAGVEVEVTATQIFVPNTPYSRPITKIERDWSAASYWYSLAALSAGWVTLPGLPEKSCQGDAEMRVYGERLGVVTAASEDVDDALELSASPEVFSRLNLDMSDNPDLVQTLAVASMALNVPFRFTGVHTLRNKETDRIAALKNESLKLGFILESEGDDVLAWEGKRLPITEIPRIATYNDHRMAMAFAPLALFLPGLVIEDSDVVSKSYPGFWDDLAGAGFVLRDADAPAEQDTLASEQSEE